MVPLNSLYAQRFRDPSLPENSKLALRSTLGSGLPKPDSQNTSAPQLMASLLLQIHSLAGDLTPAERAALICDEAFWKRLCPKLHVGCS